MGRNIHRREEIRGGGQEQEVLKMKAKEIDRGWGIKTVFIYFLFFIYIGSIS